MRWGKVKEVLNKESWQCFIKCVNGMSHFVDGNYERAVEDFNWILNHGGLPGCEGLIYKNLGIAYAYHNNFGEAEECLLKALDWNKKENEQDGELYQWLGYVYLVEEEYEQSLEYFRRAFSLGQRGLYKWLVDHEYVKDNIIGLDKIIRERYQNFFPDFEI